MAPAFWAAGLGVALAAAAPATAEPSMLADAVHVAEVPCDRFVRIRGSIIVLKRIT
jgi:hypothetical protein